MAKKFLSFLLVLMIVQYSNAQHLFSKDQINEMISLSAVDPLQKVFKETAFFEEIVPVADVARGEHASFQFAVRSTRQVRKLSAEVAQLSKNTDLINSHSTVGFVGFTRVGRPLPNPSKDKLNPTSGFFPDPILDSSSIDLAGFTTQPIWVTVTIPENVPPGVYSGMLTVKGWVDQQSVTLNRRFTIHVYPVTIHKTRLWVTNWFDLDKTKMKQLSGGKDSVVYSDRYWYWLKMIARKMKEYDQNVVIASPLFLATITKKDGQYAFDFSKFDRFVQTFADEAVLGLIEGGHIGGRRGDWYSQFGVFTPYWKNDTMRFNCISVNDTAARIFYSQFIPALMSHLKEKGWDKIYLQHICDEPEPGNEKSYGEIASYIKSLAPGIRTIDAVHSHGVNNTVDVWVPQLDFYNQDYNFYKERKMAGDEIWFYTCLAPQGEYANRFIELPLIKTRILHWINFRFGATGYLHWGWNFWSENPMAETSGIIPEAGNIMPGGDAFITYPGNGRILSSIRLEAMRDGIVDYELLNMLAEKKPDMAKEICRQVVYEFEKYDVDIKSFREKRRKILEMLSE